MPNPATVGKQVEIRCDSEGVPEPSFIIMRNGKNVSTEKTLTISPVKQSNEGPYTCIAVNIVGNDSATDILTVIGEIKFLDAFPFFSRPCYHQVKNAPRGGKPVVEYVHVGQYTQKFMW